MRIRILFGKKCRHVIIRLAFVSSACGAGVNTHVRNQMSNDCPASGTLFESLTGRFISGFKGKTLIYKFFFSFSSRLAASSRRLKSGAGVSRDVGEKFLFKIECQWRKLTRFGTVAHHLGHCHRGHCLPKLNAHLSS